MTEGLSAWAERSGRRSLCVISPHLDDAVYSAYSALTLPWFHRKVVATLVTDAPQGKKTYWATYTGFADAHVEHVERSMEDERVLAAMGVEACHLGGESENEVSIAVAVQRFSERFLANPERWVFLVPAAAGRTFGVMDRMLIRLGRSPSKILRGAVQQHPDHLQVRDLTASLLGATPDCVWGYYAENPYLTADPMDELQKRVEASAVQRLSRVESNPPALAKRESIEGYASQAKAILGSTSAERVRFASRPEMYFLPRS
jgi:hypothetical protein